jgi:hypothetical protein
LQLCFRAVLLGKRRARRIVGTIACDVCSRCLVPCKFGITRRSAADVSRRTGCFQCPIFSAIQGEYCLALDLHGQPCLTEHERKRYFAHAKSEL